MNPTNLAAFLASLCVGCGVLYANPKRPINKAFFVLSVVVASWLSSLAWLNNPTNPNPVFWLRAASCLGAFFPFLLWVIKDCAKGDKFDWAILRKGWPWLVLALVTAVLCVTPYFIPYESTREHPLRGFGWHLYTVVNGASYLVLFIQAIYDLRGVTGIQKIELQTLLFGGAASGFVGVTLISLVPVFDLPALSHSIPMVIVVFYTFTAWSITTQKVFDARHLFRSGLRLAVSIGAVAFIIGLATTVDGAWVPRPVVIILCATLITLVFDQFNLRVLRATLMGGDREAEGVRASILAVGRDEFEHDTLVRRFSGILGVWGRTSRAYFLASDKDAYTSGKVGLPMSSPATAELQRMRWATTESLLRQREAGGRRELAGFMREHDLGVMICAPSDAAHAPFMIALETRRDRSPFTWGEVKLLLEWAAIIENILSRIRLTRQARESEQLRTAGLLGASLAHEIRNPLVTLKTIAQSAHARFNDPEFRRLLIELVPAEIERIEGLVSGLMDLGRPQHPHLEAVHLNEIVETSIKLVRPKALDEAVALTCTLAASPDEITADRASIRQIILNLVMNAIQAVEMTDVQRAVDVRTSAGPNSVILEVSDNGPGIPEDVRGRLFQPFTTSNKTSGIGLGLAITADLVKLHHGQITLVESEKTGTTFRVTLPCQQPSS